MVVLGQDDRLFGVGGRGRRGDPSRFAQESAKILPAQADEP
jgi:hypothetical protein